MKKQLEERLNLLQGEREKGEALLSQLYTQTKHTLRHLKKS